MIADHAFLTLTILSRPLLSCLLHIPSCLPVHSTHARASPRFSSVPHHLAGCPLTLYTNPFIMQRTHEPVAIKAVSRQKLTAKLLENLESEINILRAISHKNIVGLDDCFVSLILLSHTNRFPLQLIPLYLVVLIEK